MWWRHFRLPEEMHRFIFIFIFCSLRFGRLKLMGFILFLYSIFWSMMWSCFGLRRCLLLSISISANRKLTQWNWVIVESLHMDPITISIVGSVKRAQHKNYCQLISHMCRMCMVSIRMIPLWPLSRRWNHSSVCDKYDLAVVDFAEANRKHCSWKISSLKFAMQIGVDTFSYYG